MSQDAPEPVPPSPRHDPYHAFRFPTYRNYLFGSLLVSMGTAAQSVGIGWEVYLRTGQAMSLAWVGLMQAIPMLLLTLPAGVLADRFDRRRIMLIGLAGTALTSVGLAVLSIRQGPIGWMYFLLLLDAAFNRVAWPARAAMLPSLVPREAFENAVKWRTSGFEIAAMVGPAIGGFLIAWSVPSAYWLSAGSEGLFMILLARLAIPPRPPRAPGERRGLAGVAADLREGLGFVWRNKLVLGAISLDLFAVLFGGSVYLLPIFATDILGVGATGLGWLRAAPAAGALVTALALAHLPPMRRAGLTMLIAVAGFGAATIVFGLSTSFWLSMSMLFLTGVFDNVSVVVRQTLVQLATPDAMRGRVSAVNAVFIGSSNELGGFESGAVAQLIGPRGSVVVGGAGTLVVVGLWSVLFPRLRRLRMLAGEAAE
jgi:MFS family permease